MGLETRDQKKKLGLLINISYSPSIPEPFLSGFWANCTRRTAPKK